MISVYCAILLSPSSQRVWIEIDKDGLSDYIEVVALFTEGVDWNNMSDSEKTNTLLVALFTEGVDWNLMNLWNVLMNMVALFTEGVDWNLKLLA